jgi:hypothetical protein
MTTGFESPMPWRSDIRQRPCPQKYQTLFDGFGATDITISPSELLCGELLVLLVAYNRVTS